MATENKRENFTWTKLAAVFAIVCLLAVGGLASEKLKIFDGTPRVIVVNGYSTSFKWPDILQDKLDRYFDGKRVLLVKRATKGGTPIAKWLNVETGEPLAPWLTVLRPALQDAEDKPVILLAQQSLQWVFGDRSEGIRNADDRQRIRQGADALEKYVTLLKKDGTDLVFVATHIYKREMEPQIGNERYALDELMRRNIPGLECGPDVWTPTKQLYPKAFAEDLKHPNAIGAELMAQKWFETLLKYDGLEIPAWSKDQTAPATQDESLRKDKRDTQRRQSRQRQRPQAPPNTRVLRDLEYVPAGHERNKLDLYLPEQGQTSSPLPLIIWVHGGGWRNGSKDNCRATRFLGKGYAVASINYRLSSHAVFPAQIEDCKAAVRWLRVNAKKYNLDAERFGVWGSSAGGHLVALLGTAGDIKDFDKGQNLNVSSRVQAVCDYYGPTDLLKMDDFPGRMAHNAPDSPESKLVGGPIQENKQAVRRLNPISYVTKNDPPFLILHGDNDQSVPHNQSQLLYEALNKTGVKVTFYTVKGGGHGFKGTDEPDSVREKMVLDFFNKYLRPAGLRRKPR